MSHNENWLIINLILEVEFVNSLFGLLVGLEVHVTGSLALVDLGGNDLSIFGKDIFKSLLGDISG